MNGAMNPMTKKAMVVEEAEEGEGVGVVGVAPRLLEEAVAPHS